MTRPSRRLLAFALSLATITLVAPRQARADDDVPLIVTAVSLVAVLIGTDIMFTAYTGGKVGRKEEPDQSWMIGQTVVAGAQSLALTGLTVGLSATDKKEEGYEMLAVPAAIWTTALTVFSAWSVGAPGETKVDARFGVSWLAGANLAFTATAVGALADGRYAPFYQSIPQTAIMAPQAVLTSIQAARDESGRPGWIALAAWSGVLTIHGVVSMVGRGVQAGDDDPPAEPPAPVLPTPPAAPIDPYYIDPAVPLPPAPPPSPAPVPAPSPVVIPAPVPGEAGVAPGLAVVGVF